MEQVQHSVTVVAHQHLWAMGQPAAQLQYHLPGPVGELFVSASLLAVVPLQRMSRKIVASEGFLLVDRRCVQVRRRDSRRVNATICLLLLHGRRTDPSNDGGCSPKAHSWSVNSTKQS